MTKPKSKQKTASSTISLAKKSEQEVRRIVTEGTPEEKRTLYKFSLKTDSDERIFAKYNLFTADLFPESYKSPDAEFHGDWIWKLIALYRGDIHTFANIAGRGLGKDVKTKLFIVFVILNDIDHYRRYFLCLSADGPNSKQMTLDLYNMIFDCSKVYLGVLPDMGGKENKKVKQQGNFDTTFGVKVVASTVRISQRGRVQDIGSRPDFVWYNDYETEVTLQSAVETIKIATIMGAAHAGLEKGGVELHTCNYLSLLGNVHEIVSKKSPKKEVLITPLVNSKGEITWPERYTEEDVEEFKLTDRNYRAERNCDPTGSLEGLVNKTEDVEACIVDGPLPDIEKHIWKRETSAGIDWGYSGMTAFNAGYKLPNGRVRLFYCKDYTQWRSEALVTHITDKIFEYRIGKIYTDSSHPFLNADLKAEIAKRMAVCSMPFPCQVVDTPFVASKLKDDKATGEIAMFENYKSYFERQLLIMPPEQHDMSWPTAILQHKRYRYKPGTDKPDKVDDHHCDSLMLLLRRWPLSKKVSHLPEENIKSIQMPLTSTGGTSIRPISEPDDTNDRF